MRRSPGLVLLLLPLLRPPVSPAQNADSAGPLRTAVSATKPMTRVRVELRGGRRLSGTLLGVGGSSLAVEDETGASRSIPFADVTRYWDRRRAIAAGAVVGGIAGAASGAFLGMLAAGLCEYDCHASLGEGAVIGGLLVGATGALAGGAIGAAIPRWSLRWRGGSGAMRVGGGDGDARRDQPGLPDEHAGAQLRAERPERRMGWSVHHPRGQPGQLGQLQPEHRQQRPHPHCRSADESGMAFGVVAGGARCRPAPGPAPDRARRRRLRGQ